MLLLTAEWLKTPTHAASFFISSPIAFFLQRAAELEMPRLLKTAELTRWQLHLMLSTPSYGVTQNIQLVSKYILILLLGTYFRITVSSRSFDHRTASRILLDTKINNDTCYFSKGFYRKGIRKNQRIRRTKNKKIEKCRKEKGPRVGLNPSYRIPTKRRNAISSDHSGMAVLF